MKIKGFFKKNGKTRPVTKSKGEPKYSDQNGDASWKKSSITDLKKDLSDERDDEKAYRSQAKRAPTTEAKRTLTGIADDEADHQNKINRILAHKHGAEQTTSPKQQWPKGHFKISSEHKTEAPIGTKEEQERISRAVYAKSDEQLRKKGYTEEDIRRTHNLNG